MSRNRRTQRRNARRRERPLPQPQIPPHFSDKFPDVFVERASSSAFGDILGVFVPSPTPRNAPIPLLLHLQFPFDHNSHGAFYIHQLFLRLPVSLSRDAQPPSTSRTGALSCRDVNLDVSMSNEVYQSRSVLGERFFCEWEAEFTRSSLTPNVWRRRSDFYAPLFPENFRELQDEELVPYCRRLVEFVKRMITSKIFTRRNIAEVEPSELNAEIERVNWTHVVLALSFLSHLVLCERIRRLFLTETELIDVVVRAVCAFRPSVSSSPQSPTRLESLRSRLVFAFDWLYLLMNLVLVRDESRAGAKKKLNRELRRKESVVKSLFAFATVDLSLWEAQKWQSDYPTIIPTVALALRILMELKMDLPSVGCGGNVRFQGLLNWHRSVLSRDWNLTAFVKKTLLYLLDALDQKDLRYTLSVAPALLFFDAVLFAKREVRVAQTPALCVPELAGSLEKLARVEWPVVKRAKNQRDSSTSTIRSFCFLDLSLGGLFLLSHEHGKAPVVWESLDGLKLLDFLFEMGSRSVVFEEHLGGLSLRMYQLFLVLTRGLPIASGCHEYLMDHSGFSSMLDCSVFQNLLEWHEKETIMQMYGSFLCGSETLMLRFAELYGELILDHFRIGLSVHMRDPTASLQAATVFWRACCVNISILILCSRQQSSLPRLLQKVKAIFFSRNCQTLRALLSEEFFNPLPLHVKSHICPLLGVLIDSFPAECGRVFRELPPGDDIDDEPFFVNFSSYLKFLTVREGGAVGDFMKLLFTGIAPDRDSLSMPTQRVQDDMKPVFRLVHTIDAIYGGEVPRQSAPLSLRYFQSPSLDHSRMKDCGFCGRRNAKQKCSRCKNIRYCNATCQRSHWKVHRRVCTAPVKTKGSRSRSRRN